MTSPSSSLVCLHSPSLSIVGCNSKELMVKAQLLTGKRGLSGVVIPALPLTAKELILRLLGSSLRSGCLEEKITSVLVEDKVEVSGEIFVSLIVSRPEGNISLLTSQFGGMDIERNTEAVGNVSVRICDGLKPRVVFEVTKLWKLRCQLKYKLLGVILRIFRLFLRADLVTVEINPLVISNNYFLVVDAKVQLDENNAQLESDWLNRRMNDSKKKNSQVGCAVKYKMSFVSIGNEGVGCVVNGAGLAMMTLDAISDLREKPLNFLDVGGSTSTRKISKAITMVHWTGVAKVILVNIFGGIVSCGIISRGILNFAKLRGCGVPVVTRMEGTKDRIGIDALLGSGIRTQCSVVSFSSVIRESLGVCCHAG